MTLSTTSTSVGDVHPMMMKLPEPPTVCFGVNAWRSLNLWLSSTQPLDLALEFSNPWICSYISDWGVDLYVAFVSGWPCQIFHWSGGSERGFHESRALSGFAGRAAIRHELHAGKQWPLRGEVSSRKRAQPSRPSSARHATTAAQKAQHGGAEKQSSRLGTHQVALDRHHL